MLLTEIPPSSSHIFRDHRNIFQFGRVPKSPGYIDYHDFPTSEEEEDMTAETIHPTRERCKHIGSLCVGCGAVIQDQYILRVAPDLEWHATCLKCVECNQYLDESCTCFVRDGKTYCKRDYIRLFGVKCAKCSNGFSKSDFVMRARNKIFHLDCFRCVACSRQLIPGDEFALRDDGLFCKADHEVCERANSNGNMGLSENNNNNINTHNNNSSDCNMDIKSSPTHSSDTSIRNGRGHGGHKDHKPTRIRTVLNEKQLHTLRTCYAANPRPDALMKEQLTEMTALSPRVIRVWFQNKRCKDKKKTILMKQMQHQSDKNGGLSRPLHGVPMVASSPVRHESNLQPSPVEVTSFSAPWKALSEFALQNELDHPPFQQLVSSFSSHQDHMNTNVEHLSSSMNLNQVSSEEEDDTVVFT